VAYVQVLLRATLLLTRGDLAEALQSYDEAERSFPRTCRPAAAGRARALVAQGEYAEGARFLTAWVDVQPLAGVRDRARANAVPGRREIAPGAAEAYDLVGCDRRYLFEPTASISSTARDSALRRRPLTRGRRPLRRSGRALKGGRASSATTCSLWSSCAGGQAARTARREMSGALAHGSRDPLLATTGRDR